jgi:hypothetical protein
VLADSRIRLSGKPIIMVKTAENRDLAHLAG